MKLTVYTAAKINLGLEIIGKQKDNYHELDMIMQSINLFDKVTVEKTNHKNIQIIHATPINCHFTEDITYKCARMFFDCIEKPCSGIKVSIDKNIPLCAGLAGGSSNGAGVLIALNSMYGNHFSIDELKQMGGKIGTDIPFCITGGTARASGIGTELKSIPCFQNYWIVLVKPNFSVSTKEAYIKTDSIIKREIKNFNHLEQAIIAGNINELSSNLYNRFEDVTPQIKQLKEFIIYFGAENAIMSGSGPSVYGIFKNKIKAYTCFQKLKKSYSNVFLCKPITYGVKIL